MENLALRPWKHKALDCEENPCVKNIHIRMIEF